MSKLTFACVFFEIFRTRLILDRVEKR